MKNFMLNCLLATILSIVATPVLAQQSRPCLMLFVGGWQDDKTELMKDIWKNYKNSLNCETGYYGHEDYYNIARHIRRFRGTHDQGHVTVIGHSLGGATALEFADNGSDHVVTLDAYHSIKATNLQEIISYNTATVPLRVFDATVGFFTPKKRYSRTYWTYVSAKEKVRCHNAKKPGLLLAWVAGSGPIDKDSWIQTKRPDDSIHCSNCDHCDVGRMFKMVIPKFRKRLKG